jgi:hypothetical protein
MLPFQGEMVSGYLNPTRWVGLAYIALSGRRKKIIKLIINKNYIDRLHLFLLTSFIIPKINGVIV